MINEKVWVHKTLNYLIEESIYFIHTFTPINDVFHVSLSLGKDSVVCEQLCKLANIKYKTFFIGTRCDPPELIAFGRKYYPNLISVYPKIGLLEHIRLGKEPPTKNNQWCCTLLRANNICDYTHIIDGTRAEESYFRTTRDRITLKSDKDVDRRGTRYKPIYHWPSWAVWEFIDKYKISYCSLYDENFCNLTCMICPKFMFGSDTFTKQRRIQSINKWSFYWKAFKHSVQIWFDINKYTLYTSNFEKYWDDYLNNFE